MFFLLYKHADDTVFDDFPMISDHFPDEHFRAFSEDYRTVLIIAKDDQN